jgi:PhnB protein
MTQLTLIPYLNFNGNTAEAMKFYQSILGGELKMQTFGEVNMAKDGVDKDKIMHAELKNENINFMASDGRSDVKVAIGDNVHLSLMGTNENVLTGYFSKLGMGGKVDMPLQKQFWGDTFGTLTDKFGVHWMINISKQE